MNATDTTLMADGKLVAMTLEGDREAFRRIVERYQTLVCSIAYNATGDLAQSEDLAQETFIAGWKQLAKLREPEKLRPWLCGIARNLIANRIRKLATEPTHRGLTLDENSPGTGLPGPSDTAIRREHEALLWSALRRMPDVYREPLILFYREQRSIQHVAAELDLSEDAVKQRLSRGRRLLHRQVVAFVEGALETTAPDHAFTASVVGALPLLIAPAFTSVASAGGTAVKWSAAGLGTKVLLALNVVIGPILALAAAALGIRGSLNEARTPGERRRVMRLLLVTGIAAAAFTLVSIPLTLAAKRGGGFDPSMMLLWLGAFLVYLLAVTVFAAAAARRAARESSLVGAPRAPDVREFRSKATFLGLPLVHVVINRGHSANCPRAVGWVAIGNVAIGVLFGCGGVAVGALSVGGIATGVFAIGAVSLGAIAIGGFAVGLHAMGGITAGIVATGAFSFGWLAAEGRYAIAHEFALGVHASAAHANDSAASAFFAAHPWMDLRTARGLSLLSLVWVPSAMQVWRFLTRRRG